MDEIRNLINQSNFLSIGDKDFLLDQITKMSPVDKLQLKHSLSIGQAPRLLETLQKMRAKFMASENPKAPGLIDKIVQTVFKPATPRVISSSILNQTQLIGQTPPQAPTLGRIPTLNRLNEFTLLEQLNQLSVAHIISNTSENADQVIHQFFEKLDQLFNKVNSLITRRGLFMLFLESPMFGSYMNTGLTALRHPELQPTSIILNTLYQIDGKHLNNKQFSQAASISNYIRTLCGL